MSADSLFRSPRIQNFQVGDTRKESARSLSWVSCETELLVNVVVLLEKWN